MGETLHVNNFTNETFHYRVYFGIKLLLKYHVILGFAILQENLFHHNLRLHEYISVEKWKREFCPLIQYLFTNHPRSIIPGRK